MLNDSVELAMNCFEGKKVKEEEEILPYREVFRKLGINPNKYMCSIEALFTRISKGKGMPSINPMVDLENAISLKYTLPMGAHDINSADAHDIEVRFSMEGDKFLPFGAEEFETVDEDELIYVVGDEVRTRRWTWRQSNYGKIEKQTNYVFFPIDGFLDVNKDKVLEARDELAKYLKEIFSCEVQLGFVDKENSELKIKKQ